MEIDFVSAECYPAAKTGGLGDVVGSLPRYINKLKANVTVIIPKYFMPWFTQQSYTPVYEGGFFLGSEPVRFTIQKVNGNPLGYNMYVIDIPGKFDRAGVYADENGQFFGDEVERYISFSRAYLAWKNDIVEKPDVIHCHDHHTGLIPFMVSHCYDFRSLSAIPTVFTIHNERYQGAFGWDRQFLIPQFDTWKSGQLDWANHINPLASGVKCSWKVTTVSPSYMSELIEKSFGLEWLFSNEASKSQGILNGIDNENWNPRTDNFIHTKLNKSVARFKSANKKALLSEYELNPEIPLVSFIGRFAMEKGADLLPGLIDVSLSQGVNVQFLVLGTGDKTMENHLRVIGEKWPSSTIIHIAYDEKLAHQIYAGSDFLIMPSRVEPCGLNQMYSMRYGTIPVVNNIGGLKDSVVDISEEEGSGIKMNGLYIDELISAIKRCCALYDDKKKLKTVRENIIELDNSWDSSAMEYLKLYETLSQ